MGAQDKDDKRAAFVAIAQRVLLDHFSSRWGQDAPLTEAESALLADRFWKEAQRLFA